MDSVQRWQDPETGIVHDLAVRDSTWFTQGGVDFRTMRCGVNVQLEEHGTLVKSARPISILWTTTQLPTSCIRCITAAVHGHPLT